MFFSSAIVATAFGLMPLTAAKSIADYKIEQQQRAAAYAEIAAKSNQDTEELRFHTANTSSFLIKSMPDVNFPLGEMYGGSIPIDESDPSRELFFIFKPMIGAKNPPDEVTIYLNGGPGCSSMLAFFQENGPFVWQPGTFLPVKNPYSWATETNMLWVDQPVGTGFSTGKVTATGEVDIAKDFVAWFKNFQQKFGIKNYKIYVTGESYAGRYVPYISAQMLDQNSTEYYNLKGSIIYDGVIGDYEFTQQEVMAYPFTVAHQNTMAINETYLAKMEGLYQSCGYADLVDKYLTFPAVGHQPPGGKLKDKCDIFGDINLAALEVNPCFNIYSVNNQCPLLWDVLSFPTQLAYTPAGANTYFDRSDVKAAINAPKSVDWMVCADHPVFLHGDDKAADPIQAVLPQVIEGTNRVLVANGDLDMIIITNGTLMAIQNMTWNGHLGFEQRPSLPIQVPETDLQYQQVFKHSGLKGVDGPQGIMGVQHYERGLMWAETYISGHEGPQYQPRASLQHLKWMLGKIETL